MELVTDWKFSVAMLASVIVIIGYIPYLRDIFKGKTKPHIYTWIIWSITLGTATIALIKGGGNLLQSA